MNRSRRLSWFVFVFGGIGRRKTGLFFCLFVVDAEKKNPLRLKDEDSEDDVDIDWMHDKSNRLIDEFTDVNTGEKDMMKLWNRHVSTYKYGRLLSCFSHLFFRPKICKSHVP